MDAQASFVTVALEARGQEALSEQHSRDDDDADSQQSTMLGLGVRCSLNRVKTHINFSRLVWTKSRSR